MPLGKEVDLGPGNIVLDGDPLGTQSPTAAPPHFRRMPIVAKRSPISATAGLLLRFVIAKFGAIQKSLAKLQRRDWPIKKHLPRCRTAVL